MPRLGLYLHIPFCKSKCLYCDFCSFPRPKPQTVRDYVDALLADLEARSRDCADYRVDTVYFGGGTPTVLPVEALEALMEKIMSRYSLAADAEITAECNPGGTSAELFRRMRRSGFNRLSLGVQSAHAEELRALGRIHTFADVIRTVEQARAAGFSNLSMDVMFGIPEQTPESYLATLEQVVELSPEHLSAYSLIVEEGTPFHRKRERLNLPEEDVVAQMYTDGIFYLRHSGYPQYEISNFAKPGYESRHNLKYWNCDPYLGFGPAAHSDFGGERFGNSRDLIAYIEGKEIIEEREVPTLRQRKAEYVMLRMRLCQGITAAEYEARFGGSFIEEVALPFSRYAAEGFVLGSGDRVAFTPRGFAVSNAILSEVLDFAP
ncbi:MAG: radical SAM family heme chaperone HemW [Clostridia bacterium]|nr:radical SAM family heme chaperone HemW [Clostridia bacterium]